LKRFLEVTFDDGNVYKIDTDYIAAHKAEYYARLDQISYAKTLFEVCAEFQDDYEFKDWARNNRDWD